MLEVSKFINIFFTLIALEGENHISKFLSRKNFACNSYYCDRLLTVPCQPRWMQAATIFLLVQPVGKTHFSERCLTSYSHLVNIYFSRLFASIHQLIAT